MTLHEFENLKEGDIVQHVQLGTAYIITGIHGAGNDRTYTAVRTLQISNYTEWAVIPRRRRTKRGGL